MGKPVLADTSGTSSLERNFSEIKKSFDEACPVIRGVITDEVTLVAGENRVKLPGKIKKPEGRLTVYQTLAADITDGGLSSGYWLVTSTATTRVKFLFF